MEFIAEPIQKMVFRFRQIRVANPNLLETYFMAPLLDLLRKLLVIKSRFASPYSNSYAIRNHPRIHAIIADGTVFIVLVNLLFYFFQSSPEPVYHVVSFRIETL